MKQFQSFVLKEFKQIFRDRRTSLILLVLPIVEVLLLGYAITTELNNAAIAVFDPSKDVETRQISERFQASRYFTVVRELTDAQEINDVFQNGDINMVLVFPERFSEKLRNGEGADIQFFIDGTDPNQASMLNGYASGILASFQAEQAELFHQPYHILCLVMADLKHQRSIISDIACTFCNNPAVKIQPVLLPVQCDPWIMEADLLLQFLYHSGTDVGRIGHNNVKTAYTQRR